MTSKAFVLVVSTIADVATDDVIRRLATASIPHHRINTEDIPFSRSMTLSYGEERHDWLELDGQAVPLPTAIWYRRVRSSAKPEGMDQGIYQFCLQESRAALLGGISGVQTRWLSHPASIWQAEHKPYQLALAAELGFRVPRTVITNSAAAIRRAAADFGRMIVKPARSGHIVHRGVEHAVFTSEFLPAHLEDLQGAELSPAIYQELVPKRFDIRVTIVGKKIFAARIDSQSDPQAAVDWRHTANPQLPHQQVTLPADIEGRLLRLMDRLELNFAAIDLIETPDGEHVFLEVNPNGQWLWLDDMLKLGISQAVADWLGSEVN
jgi:glutathione synthase/RimK-type ligase-like ATP-grasp enzyme|nr:hypothetical protein [uncultured Albidiferax sp.]